MEMTREELYAEYEKLTALLFAYAGSWHGDASEAHLAEAEDLAADIREMFRNAAPGGSFLRGDTADGLMEDFLQ